MKIAISQRIITGPHGYLYDALEESYIKYLESLEFFVIPISNMLTDLEKWFYKFPIEGIILSGGNDIDPHLYKETPMKHIQVTKRRDETEWRLLEIALHKKLPILGICRGMQFLNIFFGGKLLQEINSTKKFLKHTGHPHKISLMNTPFYLNLSQKQYTVNSYHNQAITKEKLAPPLKPFAFSSDGIIEGIYHPLLPILGIQWHPERQTSSTKIDKEIFDMFKKSFNTSSKKI